MELLKLIADKVIAPDGRVIVYNRRIIPYDPEANKSPSQKYMEANVTQFYGWINPNMGDKE